jgi:membrane associated rhomboid family serine protease
MAFLQPDSRRQPMFHVPPGALWLLVAVVAAHLARVVLSVPLESPLLAHFVLVPAQFAADLSAGRVLALVPPLFGHMFLHADFFHLGMNALWLLACGPLVARRYGGWMFWLFFLLCGIAGALTFIAFNWGAAVGMIGASGAISGLMGAAIRMIPWRGAPWQSYSVDFPLVPLWSKPVAVFTVVWLIANLVFGVTGIGSGPGLELRDVAWQAHMGGYFAGLLLVSLFDLLCRHMRRAPQVENK